MNGTIPAIQSGELPAISGSNHRSVSSERREIPCRELENGLAGLDLRLASSTFGRNKNAVLNAYAMKSFTNGLTHDDVSFGTELNYPNDLVNFRIGYLQVGENFVAGLGFVPRSDIRNFYGSFRLGPRPKIKGILQVKTGFSFTFFESLSLGELQSAEVNLNYGEIDFLSGDIISLSSQVQFESLLADFMLFQKYTIRGRRLYLLEPFLAAHLRKKEKFLGSHADRNRRVLFRYPDRLAHAGGI